MIKLIENLQQSPEALRILIKENLNNNNIAEFISTPDFLTKVKLTLDRLEEVPFFIKHVFRIVRKPQPFETDILKEYLQVGTDGNVQKLVQSLLDELQGQQRGSLHVFLHQLCQCISDKDQKEIKALLQQRPEQKFTPCLLLMEFVNRIEENKDWKNEKYKQKILKMFDLALASLTLFPQDFDMYLLTLTKLIIKTLKNPLDQFTFMVLLMEISNKHSIFIRKVIQNWQNNAITQVPSHILGSIVFTYFTVLFDHEIYFKESSEHIKDLTILCEQIFSLIRIDVSFQELGWISIFSISKWIKEGISEETLYKCIAFIRQNYFERSDIISEVLVFNISKVFNQTAFQYLPIHEILLSTLTPKELKYLIFKLDQTLTISIKQSIILASNQQKTQYLTIMALFFKRTTSLSKQAQQQANELESSECEKFKDIIEEIQKSRYNSLEKQITTFKNYYRYAFYSQLECLKIKAEIQLPSILAYYKGLFTNDYFSEEFWICEEKIQTLVNTDQKYQQKIELIFDLLQYEKIHNLSGVMILTELLKEGVRIGFKFNERQMDFLKVYVEVCLKMLKIEVFVSNVTIILHFLYHISQLSLPTHITQLVLSYFKIEGAKIGSKTIAYTKIAYHIEALIINLLQKVGKLSEIGDYIQHLAFRRMNGKFIEGSKEFQEKIIKLYGRFDIKFDIKQFHNEQLLATKEVRKLIIFKMQPQNFGQIISKITQVFEFHSPLYNGQIVALTYLARSPQENYYFKNHYIPFLYHEYVRLYALAAEKLKDAALNQSIFKCSLDLLHQVLKGDTFSHGQSFYISLNKSQLIYAILSNKKLQHFNDSQLQEIIEVSLKIVEKDNYPLLRQYISVVLCRAYLIVVRRNPQNLLRKRLIQMMRVNINIGVPISLILGYELIHSCKVPSNDQAVHSEIQGIHELLVKFISCHTAYLRAICQYYLYLYLDIIQSNDQFLTNLKQFWRDDRDSQKILTNIAIVVEGFKEGVENQCDFLGYERVEEYPTNRLKMEFYCRITKFYSEFILNEFLEKDFHSREHFDAVNQAASQRYEHLKANYLLEFQNFEGNQAERTTKGNVKKILKEKKPEPVKKEKPKKEQTKNKKGKRQKLVQAPKENHNKAQLKELPNFKLQTRYRLMHSKCEFSKWCCSNLEPQIIVIATLLEKVHNFGHILRTLHQKKAMLVVPSIQPLLHPECKELIPEQCDVQIVEIRQRDLQKFIILMKSLGYPLVALQQCSRSVMVQEAKFPQKFMMLLGNERIGAPSALLNEGDLLVEIPQIGKIRSLNVHVSMVICLWEFLIR